MKLHVCNFFTIAANIRKEEILKLQWGGFCVALPKLVTKRFFLRILKLHGWQTHAPIFCDTFGWRLLYITGGLYCRALLSRVRPSSNASSSDAFILRQTDYTPLHQTQHLAGVPLISTFRIWQTRKYVSKNICSARMFLWCFPLLQNGRRCFKKRKICFPNGKTG